MDLNHSIKLLFEESIEAKRKALETVIPPIAQAVGRIVDCFGHGHKIMICGNGGSAADAQHFAAEMLNRFQLARAGLPALALTTDSSTLTSIANDFHFTDIFSRQVQALGQTGDLLIGITTSGHSPNVLSAIQMAHQKKIGVIALTGRNGGDIPHALIPEDIEIRVPVQDTPRIQEIHILIIHILCGLVEQQMASVVS